VSVLGEKMESAELHILANIQWDLFATLTFKQEDMPERIRISMAFALFRRIAKWNHLYFPDLPWCLRIERGESTGRVHLHALIGGLPAFSRNEDTCFAVMAMWSRFGGGISRCRVYDQSRNGIGYMLKCLGWNDTTKGADGYEFAKFGSGSAELMIAKSVCRSYRAQERRETSCACPAGAIEAISSLRSAVPS
jgi:hypothetical protein